MQWNACVTNYIIFYCIIIKTSPQKVKVEEVEDYLKVIPRKYWSDCKNLETLILHLVEFSGVLFTPFINSQVKQVSYFQQGVDVLEPPKYN